jgi:hypothetical protein
MENVETKNGICHCPECGCKFQVHESGTAGTPAADAPPADIRGAFDKIAATKAKKPAFPSDEDGDE